MSCKIRCSLFCLGILCKSTNYSSVLKLSHSVAVFEPNRTIWQDFISFFWFILPGATFLVTSSIHLNWNKENLLLNHTCLQNMCGIDPYSMLLNYLLTKLFRRPSTMTENRRFMNFFKLNWIMTKLCIADFIDFYWPTVSALVATGEGVVWSSMLSTKIFSPIFEFWTLFPSCLQLCRSKTPHLLKNPENLGNGPIKIYHRFLLKGLHLHITFGYMLAYWKNTLKTHARTDFKHRHLQQSIRLNRADLPMEMLC